MRIVFWHGRFCQLKQFSQRFLFPFGQKTFTNQRASAFSPAQILAMTGAAIIGL
jgi:hypothetical protein